MATETRIRRLISEGRDIARRRGHDMKPGEINRSDRKATYLTQCRRCGVYLHCDTRPMPNGIDIGGSAVAIDCR